MRRREGIEIRIRMMRLGISASEIAAKLNVTEPFVHQVITGIRTTERIREAIAEAVGKPVEKLWPNKNPQSAKSIAHSNNQKRKAA